MGIPWVPAYFGSYEELRKALILNPFLASGQGGPHPHLMASHTHEAQPDPSPWLAAVKFLLTAISLKDLASQMPEGQSRAQLSRQAESSLTAAVDEICGTPHGTVPWPWPGPPPWAYIIASELVLVANSFQAGSLRNEVLLVAGRIAQKAGVLPGQAVGERA